MKNRLVLNVAFAIAAGLMAVSPMLIAATLPDACVSSTTGDVKAKTARTIAEILADETLSETGKLKEIQKSHQ